MHNLWIVPFRATLSVTTVICAIGPILPNSLLTSADRLIFGTPKTSKCLDSFATVYTWIETDFDYSNLKNEKKKQIQWTENSLWQLLFSSHRDISNDYSNIRSVYDVSNHPSMGYSSHGLRYRYFHYYSEPGKRKKMCILSNRNRNCCLFWLFWSKFTAMSFDSIKLVVECVENDCSRISRCREFDLVTGIWWLNDSPEIN